MAWRLLIRAGMSVRAQERSLVEGIGAFYATVVTLIAFGALIAGPSHPFGALAAFGLMPLCLYYVCAAGVTAARALRARRTRALAACVRHELGALAGGYRLVASTFEGLDREHHLLVGPNGVFVILAADDGARLTTARRRLFRDERPRWRDLIEDCHIEALRAGERLRRALPDPPPVHPILCVSHALVAIGREMRGVKIVHLRQLARTIDAACAAVPLDDAAIAAATAALTAVAPVIAITSRADGARVIPLDRRLAARRPTLV
jgi:hypothetical protein